MMPPQIMWDVASTEVDFDVSRYPRAREREEEIVPQLIKIPTITCAEYVSAIWAFRVKFRGPLTHAGAMQVINTIKEVAERG